MAFSDQNLVHSRWTPNEQEEGGDDDVQLVTKTINVGEAIVGNMEERVTQDTSVEHQEGDGATVPNMDEFALPGEEEKYKRITIEDSDDEVALKLFNWWWGPLI